MNWLGSAALAFALYAPLIGLPQTRADLVRLVLVPCLFALALSLFRTLADRL